jgi:hypothetical protein
MHKSTQYDESATGKHRVPADVRSFLQTSAHYFGLVDVPRDLLERHAVSIHMSTFRGYQFSENQDFTERGAA